jgi:hypothetical protein
MYREMDTRSHLCDFKIICANNITLDCHMAVLAARSPVFAAMLEPHTDEYAQRRVVLDDIDCEVCYCVCVCELIFIIINIDVHL